MFGLNHCVHIFHLRRENGDESLNLSNLPQTWLKLQTYDQNIDDERLGNVLQAI